MIAAEQLIGSWKCLQANHTVVYKANGSVIIKNDEDDSQMEGRYALHDDLCIWNTSEGALAFKILNIASYSTNGEASSIVIANSSGQTLTYQCVAQGLAWLNPGERVTLHSLKGSAHLNGQSGVVKWMDPATKRYAVVLDGTQNQEKMIRKDNLKPPSVPASASSNRSQSLETPYNPYNPYSQSGNPMLQQQQQESDAFLQQLLGPLQQQTAALEQQNAASMQMLQQQTAALEQQNAANMKMFQEQMAGLHQPFGGGGLGINPYLAAMPQAQNPYLAAMPQAQNPYMANAQPPQPQKPGKNQKWKPFKKFMGDFATSFAENGGGEAVGEMAAGGFDLSGINLGGLGLFF